MYFPKFVFPTDYDLILYNTPTTTDYRPEVYAMEEIIAREGNYRILIGGNPDGEAETETKLIEMMNQFYPSLPRAQFLGLLKNCKRFITNSSSAIYEAPYFLKPEQIIMIGQRNRNRPKVDCQPGGSDRIVKAIQEYLEAFDDTKM